MVPTLWTNKIILWGIKCKKISCLTVIGVCHNYDGSLAQYASDINVFVYGFTCLVS